VQATNRDQNNPTSLSPLDPAAGRKKNAAALGGGRPPRTRSGDGEGTETVRIVSTPLAGFTPASFNAAFHDRFNVVRLGLNYKFW